MELTKESVDKAVEAIKMHEDEFDAIRKKNGNLPLDEVAQLFIMDEFGDAQIEAEEIVNDIKTGLASFDAQFNKNKETETIDVKDCLEETTQDMTEEERKNCLVNILVAIELLNVKELSEDEVNAKLEENSALSEEELIEKIEDGMNSTISLESLAEEVKDGLNSEILSQVAKDMEVNKDNYRFMAALWLYVEQRKGNLKLSNSDFAMSAEQIGVLAGAAVEMIIANNALNDGEINLATWQKVIKWIVGAALVLILLGGNVIVAASVGMLTVAAVVSIIGSGMVSIFIAMVIAYVVVMKLCDLLDEATGAIFGAFIDYYDKFIVGITAKVVSCFNTLKTWAANIVNKAKSAVTTDEKQTETPQNEVNKETESEQEFAKA